MNNCETIDSSVTVNLQVTEITVTVDLYGRGNILKMTATAGSSITNPGIKNRDVAAIIISDYVRNTGYKKESLASDTVEFEDGTTLIDGQKITILLA